MPESKLLGAARMALDALDTKRNRRWCRAFVLAELRSAIAEAEGSPITLEEAGYSEGQAAYIRLTLAARELLNACKAARSYGSQGDTDDGISVSYLLDEAIRKAEPPAGEGPPGPARR